MGKIVRELGWNRGILYIVARLLALGSFGRIRVYAYYIVAQPIRPRPTLASHQGRTIVVREIGAIEARSLPVDRPQHVIEARFRQGARCLTAAANGKFLGFLWFLQGSYEEDEVRCRFVPDPQGRIAWDFDVFVDPSARLGFAFARLWDEASERLSSLGVEWSMSRISMFNSGSMKAHGRLGLIKLASAVFFCAGPVQVMFASIKPYVHVAFGAKSRPVLQLRIGAADITS